MKFSKSISYKSILCLLPLLLCSNPVLSQTDEHRQEASNVTPVKVFDNFVGQGYEIAREAAIFNSKKGVLMILICSDDTATKLHRDVKYVAQLAMNVNRPRMAIILADKPAQDSIRDNITLYANGKWAYTAFETGNNGAGDGVQVLKAIREVYDGLIKPLENQSD